MVARHFQQRGDGLLVHLEVSGSVDAARRSGFMCMPSNDESSSTFAIDCTAHGPTAIGLEQIKEIGVDSLSSAHGPLAATSIFI